MIFIPSKLNGVIQQITPHLSEATSGIINKLGIASVVTGGTNAIVTTALVTKDPTWLTVSNAVAIVSIVGSIVFIVKLITDFWYARKRDKREVLKEAREKEAHEVYIEK